MRLYLALLFCICTTIAFAQEHRTAILSGVKSIPPTGAPGPLCVFGKTAFPVIVGDYGKNASAILVAAATPEKGRIVAYGHTGYLDKSFLEENDDAKRLALNAIRWAANADNFVVGVYRNKGLAELLKSESINIKELNDWNDLSVDCVCAQATSFSSNDLAKISKYIKNGGGFIATGLGWGYLQLNPNKTLQKDHVGNQLFGPFGIVWADGGLNAKNGKYDATTEPNPLVHAQNAYAVFRKELDGGTSEKLTPEQAAQLSATLQLAMSELPDEGAYRFPKINTENASIVPTKKEPITDEMPAKRLMITAQNTEYRRAFSALEKSVTLKEDRNIIANSLSANPAGSDFPGAVSAEKKTVSKTLDINTKVPQWHSTGLYAAPGAVVSVKLPANAVDNSKQRFSIRIGCHTDTLWHLDKWERNPQISFARVLTREECAFANPFGGLVYIDVPRNCGLGIIRVEINGAIEAPYFELGKTTKEQWQTVRDNPAPWGEIASKNIVISVPSEFLKSIEDPSAVLKNYWDPTLDAIAELSAWDKNRVRPERAVPDRQISAGYMHSGYPFMAFMNVCKDFVTEDRSKSDNWGFFHELGHNHQSRDWTFDGVSEVTVNFFSLYCYEKVLGIQIDNTRREMLPENRKKAFEKYAANGKRYEEWKKDPFLALGMFVEMQQLYGWESFIKMIAEYRDLPSSERPKSDLEKRQQWVKRFSAAAGADVRPIFEKWGIPLE